MGNTQKRNTASSVRRPSVAEREDVRAKKKAVLDCLEYAGVPLEDQDATAKLLIDGGITDADKLIASNDAILASLGIKPSVRETLVKAQALLQNMPSRPPPGAPSSSPSQQSGLPPVDTTARRKKSVAAGANILERTSSRRESIAAKKNANPPVRTTKFIKGDVVEHYRESDSLLRKGRVTGVHTDDLAQGVYYTVLIDGADNLELQAYEKKLEFPGTWQKILAEKGVQLSSQDGASTSASSTPIPAAATGDDELL